MKTLTDLRVADLMQSKVLTLADDAPVAEAVETLEEYGISGAPVIDGSGSLIGFLSQRDIARSEHLSEDRLVAVRRESELWDAGGGEEEGEFLREDYSPELLGRELVRDWMNPKVITVGSDLPLKEACRRMVAEDSHRVLVVDEGKLGGILSAFDVMRYVAELE